MLTIVTITKDDREGAANTATSIRTLREHLSMEVEHLVVDSSSHEAGDEIKLLLEGIPLARYVWQRPSGIAAAFNFGVMESKGEWVWFLNGRDEVHPDLDPEMLFSILQQTRADVIIFEMEFMQSGERYRHPPLRDLWPPVYNWIPHPATIIRRKVFDKYGPFDESYKIAMDGEFWFRALGDNVVVDMISIPIVLYDESGISSCNQNSMATEVMRILRRYLPSMIKMWLSDGQKIFNAFRHFKKLSKVSK